MSFCSYHDAYESLKTLGFWSIGTNDVCHFKQIYLARHLAPT